MFGSVGQRAYGRIEIGPCVLAEEGHISKAAGRESVWIRSSTSGQRECFGKHA